MDQIGILHWLLGIVIPIIISTATFWNKINKDKQENENRITKIEADVNKHNNHLEKIEMRLDDQSKDLKLLPELKIKTDMMFELMKELRKDMKNKYKD